MSFQNARIVSVGTDAQQYHEAKKAFPRGDARHPASPSMIREFDIAARRWVRGYVPPKSKPKDWGQMFDTLVLTPELFDKRYIHAPEKYEAKGTKKGETVMKPWTRQSKTCRAWEDDQEAKGFEVVDEKILEECLLAQEGFFTDEIKHFIAESENQVLITGEWAHKPSGIVIPVECLIDLVPNKDGNFPNSIGDVKTTRNASTSAFSRFVLDNGYHIQAAFDTDLFNAATGEERGTWTFLICENFFPYDTAKKFLPQEDLERGRGEVHRILSNYATCLANKRWPSRDEQEENVNGWGVCRLPAWADRQSENAARFELDEEEADEMPEEVSRPN